MAGDVRSVLLRLWPLALVDLFAEWSYAIMNVAALPLYLEQSKSAGGLGVKTTLIGLIISTFLIFETLFKAFFGWAGDRFGRKQFIVVGLILSAITPLLMRAADQAWAFFPLRAMDGIGAAALWPCLLATVASITSEEERGTAMSIFNMMYMIGIALALPAFSVAVRITGRTHDVFFLISGAFVVAAVVALAALPQTKDPGHAGESAALTGGETAVAEPIGWREALELAVRSRVLMAMMIASLFQAVGLNLLNGVITIYAYDVLRIDPKNVGMIFIGPALAVIALALPLGWLGNRWGKVKSVWLGLAVSALAMFLIPRAHSLWALSTIVIPVVIGFLVATPAWLALITQVAPPGRQGLTLGAVATAQGVGAMIGPAVGGWTYEHISPQATFYAASVLLLLALAIAVREFREDMKVEIPN
jgi:DHA1 family multidrug resistance protein-like MFS transporter